MQTLIASIYSNRFQQETFYDSGLFTCCFSPKWKQRKLWVRAYKKLKLVYLPTEEDKQWLVGYLSRSPIEAVCLHADLGEKSLAVWADACRMARKPAFLRLPSNMKKIPSRKGLRRRLRQSFDWAIALALLLVLSPLILGLMLLIRARSHQPTLVREWCVGDRGKIFQLLTLNTTLPWGLRKLPNLVNVLRGETNLLQTEHFRLRDLMRS